MKTSISPERLAELRAMPYEEYLLSPEWQATRKRIVKRDNFQCRKCQARGVVLEVHHYTYARLGQEDDADLVTLCEHCHSALHRHMKGEDPEAEDLPELSFWHKCMWGLGTAAAGTIGLEGFLHAPLPAEIAALIGAYMLATNSPKVYAELKKRLPKEVMGWVGPTPEGKSVSLLNPRVWLGLPIKRTSSTDVYDIIANMPDIKPDDEESDPNEEENAATPSTGTPHLLPAKTLDPVRLLEQRLDQVLRSFQVHVQVLPEATAVGPRIIQLGVLPTGVPEMQIDGTPNRDEAGDIVYTKRTRIEEITKREKDIQLALGATSISILSPVPGKYYVGIEIPNPVPMPVMLADVLASREYQQAAISSKLVFALGRDIRGAIRFCDIEQAPHILIGGTTNSGKSVLLNVLIASILSQATPDEVRLAMVDPKMVELSPYNGIAHLLEPVVTDMTKVPPLLNRAVLEMQRRLQIFAQVGVKKLSEYRQKRVASPDLENLPAWVIIIDEFADLMMTAPGETEEKVIRLAQKGRATGIHLVIATQKPVVDVVTGLIKSNLPTSIALMTKTRVDSQVILDQVGAERLLGDGDMLYLPANTNNPIRIQGAYVTNDEIASLVSHWKQRTEQDTHSPSIAVPTGEPRNIFRTLTLEIITAWHETGKINDKQFYALVSQLPQDEEPETDVLDDLSDTSEEQGKSDTPAYIPPPALLRPVWKYEEYYEVAKEAYRLGYTGKRKLADFIRDHDKAFKVDKVSDGKALMIIQEMRKRGMLQGYEEEQERAE